MLHLYYSIEITRETVLTDRYDAIISILGRINKLEKGVYKLEKEIHEYIGVTNSCYSAEFRNDYNSGLCDGDLSCSFSDHSWRIDVYELKANNEKMFWFLYVQP